MRHLHETTSEAHQPDIPRVLMFAALCTKEAINCADWLSAHDLCRHVSAELALQTTGRTPSVSIEQMIVAVMAKRAGDWCFEVLSAAGRTKAGLKSEARKLDAIVNSGEFAERLKKAGGRTKSMPLNQALGALRKLEIDAEELCWNVIGYEAQWHVRLIWHEANKLVRVFPDRNSADLLGWGWQGLHVALRNFDPQRGFRFSTYACQRISGAIRDGVRSENPVPKRLLTFHRKVIKTEEMLSCELGRAPSMQEIADKMGEDVETLAILPRLNNAASIEEMTWSESKVVIDDLVESDDPADRAIAAAQRAAIIAAINNLPSSDAEIARLLLLEGLSPAEARERTGVSPRQIRQRWNRSKETLAIALGEWR